MLIAKINPAKTDERFTITFCVKFFTKVRSIYLQNSNIKNEVLWKARNVFLYKPQGICRGS